MRTLIDGSCLMTKQPTGVSIAARQLLQEQKLPIEGDGCIVTYGHTPPSQELRDSFPYPWKHKPLPSKLIHALCGSRCTSIDRLFGNTDRLLLPNMNIVGIPQVPYDLLVHDLSFLLHPEWFSLKTRAWHTLARPRTLIRGAERVFTVSHWSKQDLMNALEIPESRITVVDITPPPLTRTNTTRPLDDPYFLVFSAQDIRKNAECARRAFLTFQKEHPTYKLVLVGVQGISSNPHILHIPYISEPERVRWLEHAAALLYPSWYEGFGLPPHEAASLSVPCLAAGSGAIAETAPKGTILLPPHLPHLWYEALKTLV